MPTPQRKELFGARHTYNFSHTAQEHDGDHLVSVAVYKCLLCGATTSRYEAGTGRSAINQDYMTFGDFCPAEWDFNATEMKYEPSPSVLQERLIRAVHNAKGGISSARNATYQVISSFDKRLGAEKELGAVFSSLRGAFASLEHAIEHVDKYLETHKLPG